MNIQNTYQTNYEELRDLCYEVAITNDKPNVYEQAITAARYWDRMAEADEVVKK